MPFGLSDLPTDVLASFRFSVEIDGISEGYFAECSGLAQELQVVTSTHNTPQGREVLMQTPGPEKPPNIILKRGASASNIFTEWYRQVADGDVKGARRSCSIVMYDYQHTEVARYNLFEAWPSKVEIGGLKSGASEVLMESVTLTCNRCERAAA